MEGALRLLVCETVCGRGNLTLQKMSTLYYCLTHTLAEFVQAIQAELPTTGKLVFKQIHPAKLSFRSGLDNFCISRSRL